MKVANLKFGAIDDIELQVVSKDEPREFTRRDGTSGMVCDAEGKDETGTIKVTLWNEDVEKVNIDARIKITNGYVKEWRGEKQLSTGKYGQLELLE